MKPLDLLIIGGGMITCDLILPSVYHMQRTGRVGRITVCALNSAPLKALAEKNALAIGAGHSFIIFMQSGFPVNILNAVKSVTEVCAVYCATSNPVQVVLAESDGGRGILGVIDGVASKGIEKEADVRARRDLLRTIGYKLG